MSYFRGFSMKTAACCRQKMRPMKIYQNSTFTGLEKTKTNELKETNTKMIKKLVCPLGLKNTVRCTIKQIFNHLC